MALEHKIEIVQLPAEVCDFDFRARSSDDRFMRVIGDLNLGKVDPCFSKIEVIMSTLKIRDNIVAGIGEVRERVIPAASGKHVGTFASLDYIIPGAAA